ncbi:hypothetical protein ES705_04992 [subsurface metagenome]
MFDRKEYSRQWYIRNREKEIERAKQWQRDNPEKVSKRNKRWKENNPEKVSEQRRRYYKENQERIKQYYIKNRERIKEKVNKYRLNNPEKIKEMSKQHRKNNAEHIKQYRIKNKEKTKEYNKQRRIGKEEELKEYSKQWRIDNKEKQKKYWKQYRIDNKEKIREYHINNREHRNQCMIKRRKTDLKFNLNYKMGRNIGKALKANKAGRHWESLTGYTLAELIKQLNKTMPKGYTWQGFLSRELHIDHIIPIVAFNFTKPEHIDFKRCWALSNLRLLPAKENLSKHYKLTRSFQPALKI